MNKVGLTLLLLAANALFGSSSAAIADAITINGDSPPMFATLPFRL
jgi:hypothetical protein